MIRSILATLLFSLALGSSALAQSCTVPNTLTNGTNADATQVMGNFAAILTCLNNQAAQGAPRSYLAGLTLSTAGSSANFAIAVGNATSDDATTPMQLAASSTKTTGAWVVGSGAGSLDTGSIAATPTWYHVYLIERTDTGVVDVLISLNPTSPALPTSYTKKRRIGSMKTNSSGQWIKFTQLGDEFLWDVPVQDASNATPGTAGTLYPLTVPSGVQVRALFNADVLFNTSGNFLLFTSPDQANTTPSLSAFSFVVTTISNGFVQLRTDTSRQVRARCDTATVILYIVTNGWIDRRGRDS